MLKRNKEVLLWLTEKERNDLRANADKCGLSVQGYLRKLINGIQPKELPQEDYFEVLKVLRQISINMNQIALKANAIGFINAEAYWENSRRLQEAINEMRSQTM